MPAFIVNSEHSCAKLAVTLWDLWREHRYLKVNVKAGTSRSIPQNDIQFVWYGQMAMEDRQEDERGHRRYCKLHHGVPILRSSDEEWRHAYDRIIKPLPYELKLEAMDHWPVTSQMTKKQMTAYLEAVKKDYARRGITLEFPTGEK